MVKSNVINSIGVLAVLAFSFLMLTRAAHFTAARYPGNAVIIQAENAR